MAVSFTNQIFRCIEYNDDIFIFKDTTLELQKTSFSQKQREQKIFDVFYSTS